MIYFAFVPDKLLARFDGCLRSDNRWWNRAAESPAPLALCSQYLYSGSACTAVLLQLSICCHDLATVVQFTIHCALQPVFADKHETKLQQTAPLCTAVTSPPPPRDDQGLTVNSNFLSIHQSEVECRGIMSSSYYMEAASNQPPSVASTGMNHAASGSIPGWGEV